MEDVTRKRLLRKLESLPEEQLYQVIDYIEFLEAKYARAVGRKPDRFQEFAERVEDQMRMRTLAPKAMRGTMRLMSTAGKVIDGVRDLGRDIVGAGDAAVAERSRPDPRRSEAASEPASSSSSTRAPEQNGSGSAADS